MKNFNLSTESLRKFGACFVLGLSAVVSLTGARANTIAEQTGGTIINIPGYYGQSFTTATVDSESNISLNFFSDPATTPYALGTGFLLSMQYIGAPSGLSSLTPGFLGQAAASGGFYTFNPSLILLPGTQYFFYENALIPAGSITGGNVYAGGTLHYAATASDNFSINQGLSLNFRVAGTPTTVPDTGTTGSLLGAFLMGLAFLRRKLC